MKKLSDLNEAKVWHRFLREETPHLAMMPLCLVNFNSPIANQFEEWLSKHGMITGLNQHRFLEVYASEDSPRATALLLSL